MFGLNFRLCPLLLWVWHPRGEPDHELVCAVLSDQPTCPAAAPHVAASSIHPYPLSAHVPEVTTEYMVKLSEALHWLRGL